MTNKRKAIFCVLLWATFMVWADKTILPIIPQFLETVFIIINTGLSLLAGNTVVTLWMTPDEESSVKE